MRRLGSFFEIRQFRWTILYAESVEVSLNVICVTGEKRVEGGDGSERRIPSIWRPATQATESNKGFNYVVMLRGPVKKRSQKRE